MNRQHYLTLADAALTRAAALAREAESAAKGDARHKAEPFAAVSAAWSDIARSHAAIAQAMTDDDTISEA
ncbi:hypothetical protein [Streptomyces sp. NBC_01236]|uniref:hypothetical protein n=1 Tax=Streptomyces sp. NBC_01236 TaxID=2903789 RepID=UPI002E0E8CB4|nr:hypothetical protein OG324_21110 [Streptomyces sp. NBC_01236]